MSKEMFCRSTEVRDIEFSINGTKHVVSDKFPPSTTLNDYIRDVAGLKGTKVMCKEAGCGCCAVTVTHASNQSKAETMSINSCLCPLYSVDGWQISTVEGIGDHKKGFHDIQERLANYNGTQCGYCSPGFVMSMYGLLHQKPKATVQDIEDSFDGHLCRCTGYRAVLDAMKSFGSDASNGPCLDMEHLNLNLCPKTGEECKPFSRTNQDNGTLPRSLAISLLKAKWYRPLNLKELAKVMQQHKTHSIKLIYGNTASGIFKHEGPYEVYIDIRAVSELHTNQETKTGATIGCGTTLTDLMNIMTKLQNRPGFHYCRGVIRHLKVVASVLVRNAGSIGGNLMIKHTHPEFPSDIFTMTEAIGAKVDVYDSKSCKTTKVTLLDFLRKVDMKGKVLVSLDMPKWTQQDVFRSFKITPRWQNAHAYINAAFKVPVDNRKIIGQPTIVVGGVNAQTVHAEKTETYLRGKTLDDNTITGALKIMHSEINPTVDPAGASVEYRRNLATNLLYKALLDIYKPSRYSLQSGGQSMERPLSSGQQSYQEKTAEFPLKQPLPKKTAIFQTSGEAQYVNDIPTFQHELAGALVVSTVGAGHVKSIDITQAMRIPGVVRFISSLDLPKNGVNNYIPSGPMLGALQEELFVSGEVEFAGQAIGLILAETAALAEEGARQVKVEYDNISSPIVDLSDAIARNSIFKDASQEKIKGDSAVALMNSSHVVEGEASLGMQYHFYLENQIALTVPSEDGLDIYAASQWPDLTQKSVTQVLGKPMNYANVITQRLGGAFGGKTLHAAAVAAASAVAAEITGRPVRVNVDLDTNMKLIGKRFPIIAKYKAGCDANGKMQAVELDIYVDSGIRPTPMVFDFVASCDQGYYVPNWKVKLSLMKTNKSMAGTTRGPGSVPAALIIETVMEHLAKEIGQHPILFKEVNLYAKDQLDLEGVPLTYCSMQETWNKLKQVAEVDIRMADVDRFNKNNMWRKRGITMCGVKYGLFYSPGPLPTSVSIFAGDGTVTVITAGVEMGQGLFMKVAQAVAHTLKVPIDDVKVRPCQANVSPNACFTGGSATSERCVASAIASCEKINAGLKPLREKMPDAPWIQLVTTASFSNIPLIANEDFPVTMPILKYFTYIAGVTETEVDVLTGEFQVKRVDIMADFGESLNPTVDLGQVEGSYVMGLGAYLTENVLFDPSSGGVLNPGTWEYKPPTTKDIPIDWRIHFLPDNPNPVGILGSKATGEPPIGLAIGALLANKAAVENAREELANDKTFIPVAAPMTVEKVQLSTNIQIEQLRINGAGGTV